MNIDIDEKCSRYHTYRSLIDVSDTWAKYRIDNRPKQLETYAAIKELCIQILDRVFEEFGPLTISYGFASTELDRLVRLQPRPNTTRRSDQHAGHELNRRGLPYCSRLGQACDFKINGVSSLKVATWVANHTPYDRLYWYADDRPIHISFGPENFHKPWHLPKSAG